MKNKIYSLVLSIVCILVISVYAEETEGNVSIPRAAICADIQRREPIGSGVNFPETVGKLFFFTEIKSGFSGTIKHVWYCQDVKLNETELEYKPGQYRTWSYCKINPSQKGEWQVEAIANDTAVIKRLIFTIP